MANAKAIILTDDALAWIINLACQRPAELGYSQELWTLKNLHEHYSIQCRERRIPTP